MKFLEMLEPEATSHTIHSLGVGLWVAQQDKYHSVLKAVCGLRFYASLPNLFKNEDNSSTGLLSKMKQQSRKCQKWKKNAKKCQMLVERKFGYKVQMYLILLVINKRTKYIFKIVAEKGLLDKTFQYRITLNSEVLYFALNF